MPSPVYTGTESVGSFSEGENVLSEINTEICVTSSDEQNSSRTNSDKTLTEESRSLETTVTSSDTVRSEGLSVAAKHSTIVGSGALDCVDSSQPLGLLSRDTSLTEALRVLPASEHIATFKQTHVQANTHVQVNTNKATPPLSLLLEEKTTDLDKVGFLRL